MFKQDAVIGAGRWVFKRYGCVNRARLDPPYPHHPFCATSHTDCLHSFPHIQSPNLTENERSYPPPS